MKITAKIRLIIFAIITIVVAGFFFFEPALNIGVEPVMSMYHQIQQGQPLMPVLIKFLIIIAAVFFGLLFLIGLEEKPKDEDKKPK